MKRVYLAGPMNGMTGNQMEEWRLEVRSLIPSENVELLSPRGIIKGLGERRFQTQDYVDHAWCAPNLLTDSDRADCTGADAVLMNLLGSDPFSISIGSMIEIGWADLARVPLIVVAVPSSKYWNHPMIRSCASYVSHSLAHAAQLVTRLLNV